LQYFNASGTKLNMAQMFQQDQGRFSKFRCVTCRWPSSSQKVTLYLSASWCHQYQYTSLFIAYQLPNVLNLWWQDLQTLRPHSDSAVRPFGRQS